MHTHAHRCIAADVAWVHNHDPHTCITQRLENDSCARSMVRSRAEAERIFHNICQIKAGFSGSRPSGRCTRRQEPNKSINIRNSGARDRQDAFSCTGAGKQSFINIISDCSVQWVGDAIGFDDTLTPAAAANFAQIC